MSGNPKPTDAPPRPPRPSRARNLSSYPNVYDAAFSWDRSQEAHTFLRVAASEFGRPPKTAVELACGSGPLARLWAAQGVEVYGVDRSPLAIARAQELSGSRVRPKNWLVGDLRSFSLPKRVELAVVPLDSLGYLVEEEDLIDFFDAARRCLAPGGVLAIDLTFHPEGARPLPIRNAWKVTLLPKGSLMVEWRSHGRAWGSPPRRWEEGRITVQVTGRPDQVFWEACPHAILSARALGNLARNAGGLEEMWVYSDAAHRARPAMIRRVRSPNRVQGPRLVSWRRS
ncbi:MAG: class I SAM-dependent DNA methyltransferase [Thermoplasmata archaeon]